MERRPSKPSSIWITQFIVMMGILLSLIFIPVQLFGLVSHCLMPGVQNCFTVGKILDLAGSCILLGWLLLTIWGLQKRKLYGKWLAIAFLLFAVLVAITRSSYFQLIYRALTSGISLPAPPYDCWKGSVGEVEQRYCGYSSYVDLGLRGALDILFPASVLGFLASRVAFGHAAKRFFEARIESTK
ncbi:hypothetical protein JOY44_17130 [Phormidium sp. CLA17]|uniref:hypothetical protein n=1 Tax=Leptolyngbya sp. Cla-17 TaxID=2803751 RepID=UPI001492B0D1|nr:hypothetical protein [Leptolyngbya sp. Cla-17]MBM0743316.1 hypothetical protein [Leptolyngbya sp. Cla-17]